MKRGGDLFILGGLLLLFAVLTYSIGGRIPESPETTPRRTTFSAKPGGWKAAYLLLEKAGTPVGRITKPPKQWPDDAQLIVTATPFSSFPEMNIWDKGEVTDALAWVDAGHTLLVFDGETDDLLKKLGAQVETHLQADAMLTPQQPAVFLSQVKNIFFPGKERVLKTPASAIVLISDKKPALIVLPHGKGRIFIVATPAVIDNSHLATADNSRFFVQLMQTEAGRGKVYFNEFHQGYKEEESVWTIIGKPGQFAFYQILALVLLACFSAGRRFGLPRPMPSPPRVSSEYVSSLADLYRRARAADAALESLYIAFWRDLCRAVAVPLDSKPDDVARRAAALTETDADRERTEQRLKHLLTECEERIASDPKLITDTVLLRLTSEIEELRKELQLGGHN